MKNTEYVLVKDGVVLAGANHIGTFTEEQLANINDLLSMADVAIMTEEQFKAEQS